jgi:hypothetical protein
VPTVELNDAELELLIEALADRHEDKRRALVTAIELKQPFTERDFGMPQINALLVRIEAVYNGNDEGDRA